MGRHSKTAETMNAVHEFLWAKKDRRHCVVLNQKELAAEFGIPHVSFHRICHYLLEEKRIRQIARGVGGLKTVVVEQPPTQPTPPPRMVWLAQTDGPIFS